ncbi:MAG TPA: type II toxin-antitoxin system RelE/ParE family toxin [Caulobacteraceae bacterium]|nr:type II toxin-antitoxin system RelE/ParE family toxin [Caulobacteraceae bacterium]
MEVRWSRTAVRTRFAQLDFIARKSPAGAARLDEEIERQIDLLATQPEMGRLGRVAGTREWVIARTPFIAVYRVRTGHLELLRILHGAQKWPPEGRR